MTAATLYNAQMLGLTTELALVPWDENLPFHGQARSASCGSTLRMGLATDAAGRVIKIGISAHACAVGQAAAAVFAGQVIGLDRTTIVTTADHLTAWLEGMKELPDWPGLYAIAAARDYPARHGAIMLAWNAALDALPSDPNRS